MYQCSKCKMAVIILPNTPPIKACKCDAAIIANITSTVKGMGGIKN